MLWCNPNVRMRISQFVKLHSEQYQAIHSVVTPGRKKLWSHLSKRILVFDCGFTKKKQIGTTLIGFYMTLANVCSNGVGATLFRIDKQN